MWVVVQVAPYTDGPAGVHGVLAQAATALAQLATLCGLRPTVIDDVADLTPSELERGGVLALFTIGETPFTARQQSAIVGSWRAGRLGVLAVHSATDACHTWEGYGELVGGRFAGHPWTQSFGVHVVDPTHPATAHLPDTWAWHDEVYLFDQLRPDAEVLLSVADPEGSLDMAAPGARVPECGFPLAWCHREGRGRTFYSALGHFPGAWETPAYLRHLHGGLRWVLGLCT
jgi:type 1 glutamine amidotransferase